VAKIVPDWRLSARNPQEWDEPELETRIGQVASTELQLTLWQGCGISGLIVHILVALKGLLFLGGGVDLFRRGQSSPEVNSHQMPWHAIFGWSAFEK
jgi:hypothetical protein